jgi:hypothetical protein
MRICEAHEEEEAGEEEEQDTSETEFNLYLYNLIDEEYSMDLDEDEQVNAFIEYPLPSEKFEGLWESLVYDTEIQRTLLQYAHTASLLAEAAVDDNLISWNQ